MLKIDLTEKEGREIDPDCVPEPIDNIGCRRSKYCLE